MLSYPLLINGSNLQSCIQKKKLQQQEVLLTLPFKPHPRTCVIHHINDKSNRITDSSLSGAFISEFNVSSLMIDMIRGDCVAIKEQCLMFFTVVCQKALFLPFYSAGPAVLSLWLTGGGIWVLLGCRLWWSYVCWRCHAVWFCICICVYAFIKKQWFVNDFAVLLEIDLRRSQRTTVVCFVVSELLTNDDVSADWQCLEVNEYSK